MEEIQALLLRLFLSNHLFISVLLLIYCKSVIETVTTKSQLFKYSYLSSELGQKLLITFIIDYAVD